MERIVVHPHALKHGVAEKDIRYAWEHYVAKQRRMPPYEDRIVAIGCDTKRRLVQLIATADGALTLIYHAMMPPTPSVLKEPGLKRR